MNFNIYRRKDGRYEGRLNIGKKTNGKTQYKYVYANSYEECVMKIEQFISFYYKEKPLASLARIKFQDIGYQWLSFAKNHTKESTWSIYAYVLKRYLNPAFGGKELYLINETLINEFIQQLLTKGAAISQRPLSKVTVHNIIVILKMIFGFMEKQYAIVNPAKNIRLSKMNTRKKFLSDKHWQIIRTALQKDESKTATAISIAVYMGLRIGEICALKKCDIDFDNNILFVCKTVQRINYTSIGQKTKLVVGEPKSPASRRYIPIPDILIPRLKKFCQEYLPDDFLFGTNNKPLEPRTLQCRFKSFLQKNNIPVINFHQLRHKFAGSCVENNVDIKVLSEILGHSNVSITLNYYVHPTMDFKRKQLNMAMKK